MRKNNSALRLLIIKRRNPKKQKCGEIMKTKEETIDVEFMV